MRKTNSYFLRIALFLAFFGSASANRAFESGGGGVRGGGGVACEGSDLEVLEYYEARVSGAPLMASQGNGKSLYALLSERLKKFDPEISALVSEEASLWGPLDSWKELSQKSERAKISGALSGLVEAWISLGWISRGEVPQDALIRAWDEKFFYRLPDGCHFEQLAIAEGTPELLPGVKARLSSDQKDVLQFHEELYSIAARKFEHTHPRLVRKLIKSLLLMKSSDIEVGDLVAEFRAFSGEKQQALKALPNYVTEPLILGRINTVLNAVNYSGSSASTQEACPVSISFDYGERGLLLLNAHRIQRNLHSKAVLVRFQLGLPLGEGSDNSPGLSVSNLGDGVYAVYDERDEKLKRYFMQFRPDRLVFAADSSMNFNRAPRESDRSAKTERKRFENLQTRCDYRGSPLKATNQDWDRMLGQLE